MNEELPPYHFTIFLAHKNMQAFVQCSLDENRTATALVVAKNATKATTADHIIETEEQIVPVLTKAFGKKWHMLIVSASEAVKSIQ